MAVAAPPPIIMFLAFTNPEPEEEDINLLSINDNMYFHQRSIKSSRQILSKHTKSSRCVMIAHDNGLDHK